MSSDERLTALEGLLSELTGVTLSRGGLRASLTAFALRRTQELGLDSMEAYFAEVASPGSEECRRLLDVISVPHTWFFRDSHQLGIVVALLSERLHGERSAKIWVPACATGEDAYSLALLCESRGLPAQIVASDISPRSLDAARMARYGTFSLREFPERFRASLVPDGKLFRVSETTRKKVEFVEHNLMQPPLMAHGGWDLILCRNVLIYFDQPTALSCAERLRASLSTDGWLFFAAGELAHAQPSGLQPVLVDGRVGFVRSDTKVRAAQSLPIEHVAIPPRNVPLPAPSVPSLGREPSVPSLGQEPAVPQSIEVEHQRPETSGDRLFSGSAFIEAAEDVLRLAAESPLCADLRMLAGVALYTAGDFTGGLRESRAALLLNPGLWPAALYQGLCLERLGKHSQARGDFVYAARLLQAPEARTLTLPMSLQGLAGDLLEMVRQKVLTIADLPAPGDHPDPDLPDPDL